MKITEENWSLLKQHYQKTMKSYCSIATVDERGMPNVTPIGSLILKEKGCGCFLDLFTDALSKNIDSNPNICIIYVNTDNFYWLKSLYQGKFVPHVGFKLLGTAGSKRAASPE
jgi:uncharacterized pyridoxamine 5'-phosphate oxidase family protein